MTADADDIAFYIEPSALKVSTGSIKLWAADYNGGDYKFVYSFTDELADASPVLTGPAEAFKVKMNPITGHAQDVTFNWTRLSNSTEYDVRIALDKDFTQVVRTENKATSDAIGTLIVGPFTEGPSGDTLELMDGATYYWKIRTSSDGPLFSQWSAVRSFTVDIAKEVLPPVTITPAPPAPIINLPAPVINLPAPTQITIPPAPTIIIPAPPAPPAPIAPAYIWAIVIIGAVLVIAVIILIVRTRRPV
jgi:hypothetical protein